MKWTCNWCTHEIPNGKVKRCSRCRLTTYCSKECQTASWKAGHKSNCTPNPLFNTADGTPMPKPKKYTKEWMEQQADRRLSAWVQTWRRTFCHFAILALDLPNHPPDRNVTHCMTLWIQSNATNESEKIRDYWVKKAEVLPLTAHQKQFPDLKGIFPEGPWDPTKVRFVIVLTNDRDAPLRVRCLLFNQLNLHEYRERPKDLYANDPVDWSEVVKYMVDEMSLKDFGEVGTEDGWETVSEDE